MTRICGGDETSIRIRAEEQRVQVTELRPGDTVQDLVQALQALRVTPRDLIAILQALKQSGHYWLS